MNENKTAIEEMDQTIMSAIAVRRQQAEQALDVWGKLQQLPAEERLALYRSRFATEQPFRQLLKAGVEYYWQYAAMSETEFEMVVPDRHDRLVVNIAMSSHGLVCGVPFNEEDKRVLQGRPQNVFVNQETTEVVLQHLSTFMDPERTEFITGEYGMLKRMSLTTVLDVMVFGEDFLGTMIKARGDNELTRATAPKIGRKLQRLGLWFNFKPTEDEKLFMKANGLK